MTLQTEIIGLSTAYALLGALVLLGVARFRWPWSLKAGTIVITSAFYVFVFFRTQGLLGWSATAALPARFEVLWVRTVEPDPASNDPGAVYLWLEALDDANRPNGEPRAYRLPYTRRLAQKVEAARAEIQAGRPQGGRAAGLGTDGDQSAPLDKPAAAPGAGAEPGGDPTSGNLDPTFLGGDSRSVEFAPLPRLSLPPKDAP